MVWPSRRCSSLLLLALSAAAGVDVRAPADWTDLRIAGSKANATAVLRVQNRAGVPVRLLGCSGFEVAAGENATLPLAGLSRFWVVPTNATIDCHSGPFDDLFYFVADFTGPEAVASIGYGLAHEHPGGGETKAEGAGAARDGAGAGAGGTGQGPSNSSVAGVELTAGPPCTGNCSVWCRVGDCYPNMTVSSTPDELVLTIMGPQPSLLSYWYGGYGDGWGYGHHGWHHGWGHHHHHHGWHHGWGGGDWDGDWDGGWGPH